MNEIPRNRRRHARYPTDQFVPAVLHAPGKHQSLGGHVVDVSAGGARVVAAPNLSPSPSAGARVELVFARSDGNRELDIDGVAVEARVIDVREPPGARVIRLQFIGPTLQFLVGAFYFGEPISTSTLAGFAFVWSGVAVFLIKR